MKWQFLDISLNLILIVIGSRQTDGEPSKKWPIFLDFTSKLVLLYQYTLEFPYLYSFHIR